MNTLNFAVIVYFCWHTLYSFSVHIYRHIFLINWCVQWYIHSMIHTFNTLTNNHLNTCIIIQSIVRCVYLLYLVTDTHNFDLHIHLPLPSPRDVENWGRWAMVGWCTITSQCLARGEWPSYSATQHPPSPTHLALFVPHHAPSRSSTTTVLLLSSVHP